MCEFCEKQKNMSSLAGTELYIYNYRESTEEYPTGYILFADNSQRTRSLAKCGIKYCPMCGRDLRRDIKEQKMLKCSICKRPIEKSDSGEMRFCDICLRRLHDKLYIENSHDDWEWRSGPGF